MQEFYAADHRKFARNGLSGKWGTSVLVSFLAGLLSVGSFGNGLSFDFSNFNSEGQTDFSVQPFEEIFGSLSDGLAGVSIAVMIIISIVALAVILALSAVAASATLGHKLYYIRLMRGDTPTTSVLFSRFRCFFKAFGLSFMIGLFVLLWSFLFIVPGIIAAYRYSQAYYIMAEDPEIGIMEAIDRSKQMMKGKKGKLFCLEFSFIGWNILAGLTCGIGYLWLTPYMEAAYASFYLDTAYNCFYPRQQSEQKVYYTE